MTTTPRSIIRNVGTGVPGLDVARGMGLAVLQRLGPVKTLLARQMMFGRR